MGVKSAKAISFAAAIRILAVSVSMLLMCIAASAKYIGAGEIRGTVTDVWTERGVLVFRMDVEEQKVTGARLGDHAQLFVKGDPRIEKGMNLRVQFDGGEDLGCWPCGLNVTRVELPDGSVYGVMTNDVGVQDNFERNSGKMWWEETLLELSGIAVVLLVAALVLYRSARRARMRIR